MDEKKQSVLLENRKKINITGVTDVESFNEDAVTLDTEMGLLLIKGGDLKINKLNVDTGDLQIEGDIDSLTYSDSSGNKGSLFSKLFK